MCADLSRVESQHFLKNYYRRFSDDAISPRCKDSMSLPRGGEQKSESNQARSDPFQRDATTFTTLPKKRTRRSTRARARPLKNSPRSVAATSKQEVGAESPLGRINARR
jgi:hypothetical protein